MSRRRAWGAAIVVAAVVALVDQLSKRAIEDRLVIGERIDLLGPIELTNVGNTGIAFGLASGGGKAIIALTIVSLALIVFLFSRDPGRRGAWLAIGLLVGGAAGNLIDRIAYQSVTDFIKLPMWPAFNFADVAITSGVILLAWSFLREPKQEDCDERGDDKAPPSVSSSTGGAGWNE